MIAKRTFPPIASPSRKVGKNSRRDEIGIKREPFKVWQRKAGGLFRINFRVRPDMSLLAIHQVGHCGPLTVTGQGFQQPQKRMLAFIHNGRVKNFRKKWLLLDKVFLQSGNHISTHGNMNVGVGFLDHFSKGKSRDELHLGANRDTHHFRTFFGH